MSDNALDTLFLPFEKDILPWPQGNVLFAGARAHPALEHFDALKLDQDFYPYHQNISAYLNEEFPFSDFSAGLCLLPKQKEEAQYDLARTVRDVKAGGLILACAANDANGTRIEKWMTELGLTPQSLSKNKARACWAYKDAIDRKIMESWIAAGERRTITIDGESWISQPGIFGWDRIDAGSKLLVRHLPRDLAGKGADFGCGYGYLSRAVLQSPGVTCLLGFDADLRAVVCAKENCPDTRAEFLWEDLSRPVDGIRNLDFIVMNPPFHEGKSTVPMLGRAFISTAAASLKPGGVLYMVANAHLDYETILKTHFPHGDKLAETGGFKVFRAVK